MSKPAARELDFTTCPKHGAGTIETPCAKMVNINGMRAADLADIVSCGDGTTDLIREGSSTVIIEQLPAARMGDGSLHSGTIMVPCSSNVNIGGPKFSPPKCFVIGGDAGYQNKVLRDIWFLSRTRNGAALFALIEATGRTVRIEPSPEGEGPRTIPQGRDSTVLYDPDNYTVVPSEQGYARAQPQLQLFHELIHSGRIAEGRNVPDSHYEEEAEAIARDPISENALREELGLDKRDDIGIAPGKPGSGPQDFRPGKY